MYVISITLVSIVHVSLDVNRGGGEFFLLQGKVSSRPTMNKKIDSTFSGAVTFLSEFVSCPLSNDKLKDMKTRL